MTQPKHQKPSGVSEEEAQAIQAMRDQGMPEWDVRLTHFERKFQQKKAEPPQPSKAIPKNFIEALILESCPDMSQEMLDEIAQET